MEVSYHTPVLVEEVLRYLPTVPDGIYLDGTLGGGGHAEAILMRLSPHGRLIGFDQDSDAIASAKRRLERFGKQVNYVHDNFSNAPHVLRANGTEHVDGALLDLGISSRHVDDQDRGFSFQTESRLDMRMNRQQVLDAFKVVNSYSELQLSGVLWKYGEEKNSRRIAKAISSARARRTITTTRELADIVKHTVNGKFLQKSLARVFQGIRIEVNNELGNLDQGLHQILDVLRPGGGRLAVISYHSLEDRIVKSFFRDESRSSIPSGHKLIADEPKESRMTILTKKPIEPSEAECEKNPRARSAKLRIGERI